MTLEIGIADLEAADVRALIAAHHAHALLHTPPENIFALDIDALRSPDLSVFTARETGVLLGIGALRSLAGGDGEIKSVHVAQAARARGVGQAIMAHLIGLAEAKGMGRLWLETGSMEGYVASRALYARIGFEECRAFGEYPEHPGSTFMKMELSGNKGERGHADRQVQDQSGRV